jgi:hypothetical protein
MKKFGKKAERAKSRRNILKIKRRRKRLIKIALLKENFEQGWEEFPRGTRVEVRIMGYLWRHGPYWLKGTVVDGYEKESERGINILCDEKWHNSLDFYGGRGASIPVYMNIRPNITANIRLLNEPKRQICDPSTAKIKLKGNAAELLSIAKIAAEYSGGRLRLAYNEEDRCTSFDEKAGLFLKFGEIRLGADLETYGEYGNDGDRDCGLATFGDWARGLSAFFKEIILPIKKNLPKSYAAVWEKLLRLGEKIYPEKLWPKWRKLLKS